MRSDDWMLGTMSLNPSGITQGFPNRQALQPRQPFTSVFSNDTSSTAWPAFWAPSIKAFVSCAVFPFGRPPPCTTSMFFIVFLSAAIIGFSIRRKYRYEKGPHPLPTHNRPHCGNPVKSIPHCVDIYHQFYIINILVMAGIALFIPRYLWRPHKTALPFLVDVVMMSL